MKSANPLISGLRKISGMKNEQISEIPIGEMSANPLISGLSKN